jgi:chemotaxis protein MotB
LLRETSQLDRAAAVRRIESLALLDADTAQHGAPTWAITFSDLSLNMLCMFALMLSFSHLQKEEFSSLAGSMRAAFGAGPAHPTEAHGAEPRTNEPQQVNAVQHIASTAVAGGAALSVPPAERDVQRLLAARGLDVSVEVEQSARGLVLRVRDRALFASGSAEILPEADALLGAVLELSRSFPGTLAVEGHSDDRPIHTAQFPSNWELSAARAASVVRYLLGAGLNSEAVHIAGYADSKPLASNLELEGRTRNRRVEFVFETQTRATGDVRQ